MRSTLLLLCLPALGCTIENELQYRSTLQSETTGVQLSEDGLKSYASMVGTTCTIDTTWGCPIADEDLPSDEERIVDHYRGTTLAVSPDAVHFVRDGLWAQADDLAVIGVRTARLTDAGTLVVGGTPDDCWVQGDGAAVSIPGEVCADGVALEADRRGALVAATDEGVVKISAEGHEVLHADADRVAVDAVAGRTFLATTGTDGITVLDDDGASLRIVHASGLIHDLAIRGDKHDLVVLAETSDGFGAIERIDGVTGAILSTGRVPTTDGRLVVSGNGRTLAIVRDAEVHHYDLVVSGEDRVVNDESVECVDLPVRDSTGFSTD